LATPRVNRSRRVRTCPFARPEAKNYISAEDCRVAGRLLGLRGGAANNLQWIVTGFYWNGYQAVKWFEWHNPEYSGTGGEIGCTGSVFCN
jgi:hypothetical protein